MSVERQHKGKGGWGEGGKGEGEKGGRGEGGTGEGRKGGRGKRGRGKGGRGKGEGGRGKGGGRHKKREGVGFKGITKRKSRSSNPERATSMYTCSCQGVFIETWLSLTHD